MSCYFQNIIIENEQEIKIEKFLSNPVLKIKGTVSFLPSDLPKIKVYYGLNDDYYKNKVDKIDVDSDGNFQIILQLESGDGEYNVALLSENLDKNDNDLIERKVILKTKKPKINQLRVINFNIEELDDFGSKVFFFNSNDKTTIDLSFSVDLDENSSYYYKLWMSYDEEPEGYLEFNSLETTRSLDITGILNGEYYLYLKIKDSAGNFSATKQKINISKINPEINTSHLVLLSNNYYLDLNDAHTRMKLLVNVKAGIKLKSAELRLYRDGKYINFFNQEVKDKINKEVTDQLKVSGLFYLEDIYSSNWNLSQGGYQLEIFYTDIFGNEYATERVELYAKSDAPKLYSNDLKQESPSNLILSNSTELTFFIEDHFFSILDNQIEVWMQTNEAIDPALRTFIKVSSYNTNWEEINEFKKKTTLKLFLNNDNSFILNDEFVSKYYEFRIKNDHQEEAIFRIPIVFKQFRNELTLHDDFLNPIDSSFPKDDNGFNANLLEFSNNYASIAIPKNNNSFLIKMKILNDVNIEGIENFKTSGNFIICETEEEKIKIPFTDKNEIYLNLKFNNTGDPFSVFLYPEENRKQEIELNKFELFFEPFDLEELLLNKDSFNTLALKKTFLIPLSKDIEIISDSVILDRFNDNFSFMSFIQEQPFLNDSFKKNEIKTIVLKDNKNRFSDVTYDLNVNFFKDLSAVLKDKTIDNLVFDSYFNLTIDTLNNRLAKELIFYLDNENKYDLNNISSREGDFKEQQVNYNYFSKQNLTLIRDQNGTYNLAESVSADSMIQSFEYDKLTNTFSLEVLKSSILGLMIFTLEDIDVNENYFSINTNDCILVDNGETEIYSFQKELVNLTEELNLTLEFYNEEPINELIIKGIESNMNSSIDNYSTIYYKYKELDYYFSFKVFYNKFVNKLSSDFYLTKAKSKLTEYNRINYKIFGDKESIQSIELLVNGNSVDSFSYNNEDTIIFDINNYNNEESVKLSSGVFLLKLKVNLITSTGDIFSFYTAQKELEIIDDTIIKKITLNNTSFLNNDLFKNSKFYLRSTFSTFEEYILNLKLTKIKEYVNGEIEELLVQEEINSLVKQIKNFDSYTFEDFFSHELTDGLYNLKFYLTNNKSGYCEIEEFLIQINSKDPDIIINNDFDLIENVNSEPLVLDYVLKNDFLDFENCNVTATVINLNTGIEKKFYPSMILFEPGESNLKISVTTKTGLKKEAIIETSFFYNDIFTSDTNLILNNSFGDTTFKIDNVLFLENDGTVRFQIENSIEDELIEFYLNNQLVMLENNSLNTEDKELLKIYITDKFGNKKLVKEIYFITKENFLEFENNLSLLYIYDFEENEDFIDIGSDLNFESQEIFLEFKTNLSFESMFVLFESNLIKDKEAIISLEYLQKKSLLDVCKFIYDNLNLSLETNILIVERVKVEILLYTYLFLIGKYDLIYLSYSNNTKLEVLEMIKKMEVY